MEQLNLLSSLNLPTSQPLLTTEEEVVDVIRGLQYIPDYINKSPT